MKRITEYDLLSEKIEQAIKKIEKLAAQFETVDNKYLRKEYFEARIKPLERWSWLVSSTIGLALLAQLLYLIFNAQ